MAAAQDAIDALAAKQGVAGSVTPTNLSVTLQDIYNDPNIPAIISSLKITRVGTQAALIPSPPTGADISTGVDLTTYSPYDDFTIGVLFTFGGETYGIKDNTTISGLDAFPGLEQARLVEVKSGNSQVKLFYWFDTAVDDLKAYIEVDGPGVVITGIRVVIYSQQLEPA